MVSVNYMGALFFLNHTESCIWKYCIALYCIVLLFFFWGGGGACPWTLALFGCAVLANSLKSSHGIISEQPPLSIWLALNGHCCLQRTQSTTLACWVWVEKTLSSPQPQPPRRAKPRERRREAEKG